jgi:tetratricopeptide (TPR) repeat protein
MTQTLTRLDARALRVLVRELCDLCNDAGDVHKILSDAEVPSAGVHFDDRILILWTSALREAQHHRRTTALLERVRSEYPDAPAVTAALEHPWDASVDEPLEELLKAVRMGPAAYGLIRSIAQPLPSNPPPSAYLKAQHSVIEFTGRETRLENLLAWCQTPEPFAVYLLTGAGGMGKTRLLMQTCQQIKERHDWIAGFIGRDDIKTALQAHANDLWTGITHQHRPTLIVIDYAESRLEQVRGLLQAAFERHTGPHPLRLILLARDEGGWWTQLCEDFPRLNTAKAETLESLTDSETTRLLEYERALEQFNTLIRPGQAAPQGTPDLSEKHFARVLMVHAAALMRLYGFRPVHDPDGTQLLEELLKRERHYWGMHLEAKSFTALEDAKTVLQHAMTLVTLGFFVGTNEPEPLANLLALLPKAAAFDGDKRLTLARILHEVYPSPNVFVDSLQPDVFGEHVVHASLTSSAGQVLIELAFDHEHANPEVALTVLARLASRRPIMGEPLLESILIPRLERLAKAVVSVALTDGVGLLGVVERVVRNAPTSSAAMALVNAIPRQTQLLLELALICNQVVVNRARLQEDLVTLVTGLLNLSNTMGNLGQHEQALQAIQESINLYRELARDRLDAFNHNHLARSLNNLSITLSDVGQHELALQAVQEAVNLNRESARLQPDAFRADLAMSLNNLSTTLSDLGQHEPSLQAVQEAIDLYRDLARVQPDVFNSDLAMSLNNLSVTLNGVGQREQALQAIQEAVAIRRQLARAQPDSFNSDLAMSLNNLCNTLSHLDRHDSALQAVRESVSIRRELAQARPDIFNPDLASSLNNLSNTLSNLRQQEQALQAIQEAVSIRRELARVRPDAFTSDFAGSLKRLSDRLGENGEIVGAQQTAMEAVRFMRVHFLQYPQVFKDRMLSMLQNYIQRSEAAGVELDRDLLEPLIPYFSQQDPDES